MEEKGPLLQVYQMNLQCETCSEGPVARDL